MKKILYYLRLLLFISYLIMIFLLIDNLYKTSFLSIIFFLLNLVYSLVMILTVLSKKKIYQETISFNFLNIGIYTYIFMLYRITSTNSILDIINNKSYFNNNYIMLSILLIGLTTYAIFLNNEKSGN